MQWFHRRSTKCGRGRGRRTNSARISHPPPFRRVTKNGRNWPPLHCTHPLGLEFNSAARLSKRPGSVWNCLWGHALKRSAGIKRKSRVSYPGPGFLSSATLPSMPKKHYNGLIIIILTISVPNELSYSALCLDSHPSQGTVNWGPVSKWPRCWWDVKHNQPTVFRLRMWCDFWIYS